MTDSVTNALRHDRGGHLARELNNAFGQAPKNVYNANFPSPGNPVVNHPGIGLGLGFAGGLGAAAALTLPFLAAAPPTRKITQVPGPPPFKGGQGEGIRYLVTIRLRRHSKPYGAWDDLGFYNEVDEAYFMSGKIVGTSLEGSPRPQYYRVHTSLVPEGGLMPGVANYNFQFLVSAQIISIVRVDNQPDNDGDPPPGPPVTGEKTGPSPTPMGDHFLELPPRFHESPPNRSSPDSPPTEGPDPLMTLPSAPFSPALPTLPPQPKSPQPFTPNTPPNAPSPESPPTQDGAPEREGEPTASPFAPVVNISPLGNPFTSDPLGDSSSNTTTQTHSTTQVKESSASPEPTTTTLFEPLTDIATETLPVLPLINDSSKPKTNLQPTPTSQPTPNPDVAPPELDPQGNPEVKPKGEPKPDALSEPPDEPPPPEPPVPDCKCNGPVLDKLNELDNKLNPFDLIDLSLLSVINNKLGEQVPGGLSGWLQKFGRATRLDKVINALNLLLAIHNAAMLSRNLADSIGYLVESFLQVIGLRDEEDQPLNISNVIGTSISSFIQSVIGVETYQGLSEAWKKLSAIYTAAVNIYELTLSSMAGLAEGMEIIGEYQGKIGNALKRGGVVLENAYQWMDENIRLKTGRLGKVQAVVDGLQNAQDVVSNITEVTEEVRETQENITQIKEEFKKIKDQTKMAEDGKTEVEDESKGDSQSPDITKQHMVRQEDD